MPGHQDSPVADARWGSPGPRWADSCAWWGEFLASPPSGPDCGDRFVSDSILEQPANRANSPILLAAGGLLSGLGELVGMSLNGFPVRASEAGRVLEAVQKEHRVWLYPF